VAALFDGLGALPEGTRALLHLDGLTASALELLPLSGQGFGWVCPALLGTAIGLAVHAYAAGGSAGKREKTGGER